MASPCLSILVLTEDGSAQAHDTCAHAIRQALLVVDPDTGAHRIHWMPANDAQRAILRGNQWKSTRPADHRARVELCRTIATKLCEQSPPGFVVFHYDGDTRWSERPSPHAEPFRSRIREQVRLILEDHKRDPEAALARLHEMVPHDSIEAWAFQNVATLRKLLPDTPEWRQRLDAWEMERARLDELQKPKEAVPFRDRHNAELLERGWPRGPAREAGASFAAFCEDLRGDAALTTALRATWET